MSDISREGSVGGQFFEDATKMVCYSKCTDSQDSGYFGSGLALLDPINYFSFAAGQLVIPGARKRLAERVYR